MYHTSQIYGDVDSEVVPPVLLVSLYWIHYSCKRTCHFGGSPDGEVPGPYPVGSGKGPRGVAKSLDTSKERQRSRDHRREPATWLSGRPAGWGGSTPGHSSSRHGVHAHHPHHNRKVGQCPLDESFRRLQTATASGPWPRVPTCLCPRYKARPTDPYLRETGDRWPLQAG